MYMLSPDFFFSHVISEIYIITSTLNFKNSFEMNNWNTAVLEHLAEVRGDLANIPARKGEPGRACAL